MDKLKSLPPEDFAEALAKGTIRGIQHRQEVVMLEKALLAQTDPEDAEARQQNRELIIMEAANYRKLADELLTLVEQDIRQG